MPVKCVTGGLLFRTSNDLDWHIREEHLQRETPPAKDAPVAAAATRGGRVRARRDRGGASRSPVVAQAVRPAPPEPPSGQGRGGA
jgi:hypothetical protein